MFGSDFNTKIEYWMPGAKDASFPSPCPERWRLVFAALADKFAQWITSLRGTRKMATFGSNSEHFVAGVFGDADAFVRALNALLRRGFDRAAISVLADHDAVKAHFGNIPSPDVLTDAPDTPREDLDTEGALRTAINFIAESVAIIGEIGAAGIAYAVGGPVGIASSAATSGDLTVADVLTRYVDADYHARFAQSVRDGGVICWVHVTSPDEAASATETLTARGGANVHAVDLD